MKISHQGQSLTEILVALAIGVAFINVGILAMSTANILAKVNKANNFALSLLKSQRSILETISENGWHSIADLTIGKHYKLAKQNNTWVIQQGEEKVFNEKPPVAQWNFDEQMNTGTTTTTTPTVAYDNIGTNDGTLYLPTWQTGSDCVDGSCLSFNGSNNYASISTIPNLPTGNTPHSIEAWIKVNSLPVNRAWILLLGNDGTGAHHWLIDNLGVTQFGSWGSVAGQGQVQPSFPIGQWKHIVVTFDGTTIRGYENGQLTQTNVATFNLLGIPLTLAQARFGENYFNGSMDGVRIYDYAITEGQVQQHYNAGLNRLGLVAQWGMDEGSGITSYDSQGANDGTLVSGPTWQTGANCVSGGCLGFTSGQQVVIPDDPSLDIADNLTISLWFYPKNFLSDYASHPIAKWNGGITDANFVLYYFGDYGGVYPEKLGDIGFYGTGGGVWYHLSPLYKITNLNTWYNIVLVYNSVSGGKLYVNGTQISGTAGSGTLSVNTYAVGVGSDTETINSIDDVRIYNRTLSTDEIANQYKDGYTKYFYVNNVSRDIASDPTASTHNLETTYNANHDDPNTKKITNVTRYLLGTPGRVNTQEQYLARASNINSLIQTDWSGNSGVAGPEIDFGNNYFSSSNLTLSTAGQMSLTSAASDGNLISSIIDTQSIGGAGYFNILWQGDTLCSGCSVKFQIATSNSNAGPWTYYGPTSTSDYYTPSGPNTPVPITYAGQYSALSSSVQNKRYIRYQITLVPASSTSPVVKDAIINYAQ